MEAASSLITDKRTQLTDDMWSGIIEDSASHDQQPQNMIDALHFDDRRLFFNTFSDRLLQVMSMRETI